jgi:hypothetical protein
LLKDLQGHRAQFKEEDLLAQIVSSEKVPPLAQKHAKIIEV